MKYKNFNYPTRLSLLLCLIFSSVQLLGQNVDDVQNHKKKYPNTPLVRLTHNLTITLSINDDDYITVEQESLNEELFLTAAASQFSKESISYSSFFQVENIEASSLNIVDGKYKEATVKKFKEKDELTGSFYDDVRSINFIYPNLG